jgi:hypothetical protein
VNGLAPKNPPEPPSTFLIAHFAFCLGELHGCLFQVRQDEEAMAYFAEHGKPREDLDELSRQLNEFAGCFYKLRR